jgi:hypothetical protein
MGLAALSADYLFLAPLIAARLEDQVPDLPVDVCETVDQVLRADVRQRVLMVMWAGDRFDPTETGRARGGASQIVHQRWLVVLGLNNVGKAADARHVAAGPTLSQVHRALAGWQPAGAERAFRRAGSAMQPSFTSSKAVYPLGFEITLTL